ncbi:MAG: hypothetical protein ACI8TA_003069 [Cyclobacteriaceae bacterium]|jgi:hypothetical protein
MTSRILLSTLSLWFGFTVFGQTEYAYETFDDTRIVNGHSIETNAEGILTFIIAHRFGPMNSGPKFLWGLDNATMRIGLDYGINKNLTVRIGRTSTDGTVDGFAK